MTHVEMAARILAVLLSRPESHTDVDRTPEAREARLAPVARAVSNAAKTLDEAAILVALGEHETHYAEHVLAGHCDQMPEGERCDGGKARGPWQLHKEACQAAWVLPDSSPEALDAEAGCALRLMRWYAVTKMAYQRDTPSPRIAPDCKNAMRAAFAGMGALPCDWIGAEKREATAWEIRRALSVATPQKTASR